MNKIYLRFILIVIVLINFRTAANADTWQDLFVKSKGFLKADKLDSAVFYADESLKIGVHESPAKHAVSLGLMSSISMSMGDYDKAYQYLITRKNILKSAFGVEHPSYALTLNNLSVVNQYLGRYEEARQNIAEAIEIKRKISGINSLTYSHALNNSGRLLQTFGEFEQSEKMFKESLKNKEQKNVTYANTIFNLGTLYYSLADFIEAEKLISESYFIFKDKLGETHPSTIYALLKLGLVNSALSQSDQVKDIINRFNKIKDKIPENRTEFISPLYDFAVLLWTQGKMEEALAGFMKLKPLIEKHLGKTNSLYAYCLNALGIINWFNGKYDIAQKYLSEVVALREIFFGENNPDYSGALFNLAGIQADAGDYRLADDNFRKALDLNLKLVKQFFPFLSEDEKEDYIDKVKLRYGMFASYILDRVKESPKITCDLYNFTLAFRSILLNSSSEIRRKIESTNNNELITIFDDWKHKRQQLCRLYMMSKSELSASNNDIEELEKAVKEIEKKLSSGTNGESGDFFSTPKWQDIQGKLAEDEVAIEIIRFEAFRKGNKDQYFYIALILTKETKDAPTLLVLDAAEQFESVSINNYLSAIKRKVDDNSSYLDYWSKIEEKIPNKKTIYIAVDGVYHRISMNTLHSMNGKYLLDSKKINLVLSTADILKRQEKSSTKTETAVLLGAPAFASSKSTNSKERNIGSASILKELKSLKIEDLPGAKKEIDDLGKLMTENKIIVSSFTGAEATKSNLLKTSKANILHIATHGFFLSDNKAENSGRKGGQIYLPKTNPMIKSGLLLAGSKDAITNSSIDNSENNGILTSYEVMNSDFHNTDLVVLSACETGLGEIKNGEGVYGLTRAFYISGAKSLLMSLWNVNDQTTQELMFEFYKGYLGGKSKIEALREAQLKIKEKYPNPYYWGAFVLCTDY
ncbi:MAG: CHAT domain-containing protein [Candidatus Kapabacteria bacterium]|nr:CHAT domain-containing protein [Candidatus Kapabacteria bacterium]